MPIVTVAELEALIGTEFGVSEWTEVTQERINQFADVTVDHQFIHIDEARAKQTPFGGTIAHGFLTLSLLSKFGNEIGLTLEGVKMGVNYGLDKIRFLAPVRSGKRIRGRFTLSNVVEKKPKHYTMYNRVTVEIEGEETPALIADWLVMQIT